MGRKCARAGALKRLGCTKGAARCCPPHFRSLYAFLRLGPARLLHPLGDLTAVVVASQSFPAHGFASEIVT